VFAFVVLPALALLLACAAGYLKWQNMSDHSAAIARVESVAAARDATIALLSYQPDTAEKDLNAARDRLTGTFKDSYTQLTHDVVIPGAKEKHISAAATVPAAAAVKATPNHAVVLLYVNQTTVVGGDAPSDSVSTVRVTLDNIHGRWLVSEFDPL
jgi:Mce-associated membrane protein